MIKLSDRLMLMAAQIKQNETMADIGTDHGFLPMYLLDEGICKKVILADVSKGSLDKAKNNMNEWADKCREEGKIIPEDAFDFRLGDGIAVLEEGEADAVVIAGMGGILISEILERSMSKAEKVKRFILQPRNGQGKLRYWLIQNGFSIEKELLVREGKFIPEIIVAVPGAAKIGDSDMPQVYGHISYELPEKLLENGELAIEFLERRLAVEKRILETVPETDEEGNTLNTEKINKTKENIDYIVKLMGGRKDD